MSYFLKPLEEIARLLFIGLLYFYRYFLAYIFGNRCRYQPTCSEFALEAFSKHSVIDGISLTFRRIIKCHNMNFLGKIFGKSFKPGYGFDPLSNYKKQRNKIKSV